MKNSSEQRLDDANNRLGRANDYGGAQAIANLLGTSGPPAPILQSEDGELIDEDSPTSPAGSVDTPR